MAALLKSALRSVLWLSMVLPDMRYPFGPLGSAAECLFPPSFLHTPRLLVGVHYMVGGGRMGKKEKTLALCKYCSAVTKTLVFLQCYFNHITKAQHDMGCYEKKWTTVRNINLGYCRENTLSPVRLCVWVSLYMSPSLQLPAGPGEMRGCWLYIVFSTFVHASRSSRFPWVKLESQRVVSLWREKDYSFLQSHMSGYVGEEGGNKN